MKPTKYFSAVIAIFRGRPQMLGVNCGLVTFSPKAAVLAEAFVFLFHYEAKSYVP
jgi:hypothetical protein